MNTQLSGRSLIDAASRLQPRRGNPFLWRMHFKYFGGDRRQVNPRGLYSGILAENCLRPWLREGDGVFFDTTMVPRHGELVLVKMKYQSARSTSLSFFGGATPGVTTRNSVKQLQIDLNGQHWLVCADGRVEADLHQVVGVLIATNRPPFWSLRRWRYPMRKAAWPPYGPTQETMPEIAPEKAAEAPRPSAAI